MYIKNKSPKGGFHRDSISSSNNLQFLKEPLFS